MLRVVLNEVSDDARTGTGVLKHFCQWRASRGTSVTVLEGRDQVVMAICLVGKIRFAGQDVVFVIPRRVMSRISYSDRSARGLSSSTSPLAAVL